MKKPIRKPGTAKPGTKKRSTAKTAELKRSKLDVFDIPDDLIDDSPDNPQEMDDATFDELVEGIKAEGFDEPIHVIRVYDDEGEWTGRYMITSGHHRRKGGKVVGMSEFPAIIKKDMDDAARKVALVRRNQLKGSMNPKKFSALFREVAPILGQETAKKLMGFTKEAAFKKMYEDVQKSLPPAARAKMEEAKEDIRSVDDLSSILNGIFKQEGSKVQNGYMVFSYGGKKHHYFQIGKGVSNLLEKIERHLVDNELTADEFFSVAFRGAGEAGVETKPKKKVMTRAKTDKKKPRHS